MDKLGRRMERTRTRATLTTLGATLGGQREERKIKEFKEKGVQRKRREAKGREQEKKRTQNPQGKRNLENLDETLIVGAQGGQGVTGGEG
jgi:hypothetical protein